MYVPFVPFSTVPKAVMISLTGKGKAPNRPKPSLMTSRHVGGTLGYRWRKGTSGGNMGNMSDMRDRWGVWGKEMR